MAPPSPVQISHKKDGRQRWPYRFHVSWPPPYPATGSDAGVQHLCFTFLNTHGFRKIFIDKGGSIKQHHCPFIMLIHADLFRCKIVLKIGRRPREKIAAPLQENLFLFEKSNLSTLFVYKSESLMLLLWVDVWLFNGSLENCFMCGYIPLGYVFVFRFRPPF